MTTFDQTAQKRKKFVELFKKHRELVIVAALDVFKDANEQVPTNVIKHLLNNQQAPAQLWDQAADDETRQKLFDALIASLTEKQTLLYGEIEALENLKTELSEIPDEEDSDDDDDVVVSSSSASVINLPQSVSNRLYHATPRSNLPSIESNGLLTMQRQHVFFWEDEQEAINVASRHGDPDIVVIAVDRDELESIGLTPEQEDFGYGPQWCVRGNVPAQYLVFP